MHHKFMVVDNFDTSSDPLVLLGSHNWSSAAQTKNDENTLIVHDANIVNQYYQSFAYLYLQAGGIITNPPVTSDAKSERLILEQIHSLKNAQKRKKNHKASKARSAILIRVVGKPPVSGNHKAQLGSS